MALEIIRPTARQDVVTSNARLWLTADRESVVEDGHPDAAFLLVCEGGEMLRADAERYGLIKPETAAADGDVDLDALNVKELKALADDVGVDRAGLSKKADLIAALTADGARIHEGTGEPREGVEMQLGETGVISGDDES